MKKTTFSGLLKSVWLGFAVLLIMGVGHDTARADEVTLTGSTTGSVIGVPPLIFTGNSFTGTTALGAGALSGANSLGTFFLSPAPLQNLVGAFTLNISFTSPTGIAGGQGAIYTAVINGSVSPNIDQGGVNVHFANNAQVFNFSNPTQVGFFSLILPNDLFVQTGRTAALTAGFNGEFQNPVPEPATLILLGTGLTGIAARLRARKKAKEAEGIASA